MTMGEIQKLDQGLQEEQQDLQDCVRRCRRNAMGDIFEGVESAVMERLAGLSLEMVQQLIMDSAHDTDTPQCLSEICSGSQQPSSPSSSSSSLSSDDPCCCESARLQRSFSSTDGEEMQAALALQNGRHRRNAVGNLFDLLTLSQQLLLVEHLQEQMERLPGVLQNDADNGQVVCSLSSSSSSQSSGSSSTVSSPRSQGEIVCR